jgi:1,4-dihydroxy-2-naphthoyl-CoA synthase
VSNPGRANALSCGMMAELHGAVHGALEAGIQSGVRGVVLLGEGGTFCSGADLRSSPVFFQPEVGAAMNLVMTHATATLRRCGLLSVAAIDGHAVGGGAELATACDFRIMAADAALQFVHVTRGEAEVGLVGGGDGGGSSHVLCVAVRGVDAADVSRCGARTNSYSPAPHGPAANTRSNPRTCVPVYAGSLTPQRPSPHPPSPFPRLRCAQASCRVGAA